MSTGPSESRGLLPIIAGAFASREEMEVRSTIHKIVLEHRRRYCYRRVTAELRRRGMLVNHKRVSRLMREDDSAGRAAAGLRGHHRLQT